MIQQLITIFYYNIQYFKLQGKSLKIKKKSVQKDRFAEIINDEQGARLLGTLLYRSIPPLLLSSPPLILLSSYPTNYSAAATFRANPYASWSISSGYFTKGGSWRMNFFAKVRESAKYVSCCSTSNNAGIF